MSRSDAELMAAHDLKLPIDNFNGDKFTMKTSEQIHELATALAKAQGQMVTAKKDKDNPFFKSKYADLAAIIDVVREPLATHGLAIVQGIETDATEVIVTTMLTHSSGQWITSSLNLRPTKNDPQGVASAATYGRRIGLQALVGVAADVDDDGCSISATAKPQTKPIERAIIRGNSTTTTTPEQREFNAWVKPIIEAGSITRDSVCAMLDTYKHDYRATREAITLTLT
jgi:hypothetical protein